jgi:hypothetical protein
LTSYSNISSSSRGAATEFIVTRKIAELSNVMIAEQGLEAMKVALSKTMEGRANPI